MELTVKQQIEAVQQALDKATQAGVFNLQEAFYLGQVVKGLHELPAELEELKKHNAELAPAKAIDKAKNMPITKN